jgi:xanthine dehydrogenase YagR molybdenum-binding subunit
MLYGMIVRCPHAHVRIKSIDTSEAEKHPAVKAVELMTEPGKEIFWAGDELVALAATDEVAAEDAARLVKIEYEVLPHLVSDAEPPADVPEGGPLTENEIRNMIFQMQVPAGQVVSRIEKDGITFTPRSSQPDEAERHGGLRDRRIGKPGSCPGKSDPTSAWRRRRGDPDQGLLRFRGRVGGIYGCLSSRTAAWSTAAMSVVDPDHLFVHVSTQNVSGIPGQMSEPLKMPATNIRVHGTTRRRLRQQVFHRQRESSRRSSRRRRGANRSRSCSSAGPSSGRRARPSAYARQVGARRTARSPGAQRLGTGGIGEAARSPLPTS